MVGSGTDFEPDGEPWDAVNIIRCAELHIRSYTTASSYMYMQVVGTPKLGFLRVGRQVDTLPPLTREGSVSHRLFIGTVGDYHFKPFFTPSH